jgi:citrate lyase subunit beta/citryl-CoA lyase
MQIHEVLRPPIRWCYFGAEDFVADMGGVRTPENLEVVYARSRVVLAARVSDVRAIDQIVADFRDDAGYLTEAHTARALGYGGKLCIHPAQVSLAHEVFTPSGEQVDRARRLLAAYAEAAARGEATLVFEGEMVDEPMARRARSLLDVAGEASGAAS